MTDKIRVLVVDDTLTSRQLMTHIINHSGDMVVVGEGQNGEQALHLVPELQPDVVLMDMMMPRMDGLEATRQLMRRSPVPIVLITASLNIQETDVAFQAMKAGALTVLQKPAGLNPADMHQLRTTLRSMAGVKVIHHFDRRETHTSKKAPVRDVPSNPRVIAIAASTGGPAALSAIIRGLPPTLSLPVVIVQHISADFVQSLVAWLQTLTPLTVRLAEAGAWLSPGTIYLAPGDAHLSLESGGQFALDNTPGVWRYMPSCDVLLHSVARTFGQQAIGIVLTGMGDDGADGLRAMYDAGAYTIAQDEDTSIVYGMPAEALRRGGVQQVLPLDDIAPTLETLIRKGVSS
jgi:two-component system chemotaxis response regulator CheB